MTFPFPTFCPVAGAIPLEFVDSAAAKNTGQITIPVTAAAGDYAILFDFARNSSPVPAEVVPAGWTKIITETQDAGSNDTRILVSHKTLASGDPGSLISGMSGTHEAKIILVFKQPATPAASLWQAECTPTNPTQQNVAASGVSAPLIVFGCGAGNTSSAVSFSTASPAFDATVSVASGASPGMTVGYKIYEAAPQNHSIDINDLGDANALASGVVSF